MKSLTKTFFTSALMGPLTHMIYLANRDHFGEGHIESEWVEIQQAPSWDITLGINSVLVVFLPSSSSFLTAKRPEMKNPRFEINLHFRSQSDVLNMLIFVLQSVGKTVFGAHVIFYKMAVKQNQVWSTLLEKHPCLIPVSCNLVPP